MARPQAQFRRLKAIPGFATIGVYGLMSYTVADRSHEIGIRMTIGAEPKQILWLVMSHALKLAAISLAIGTAGDLLASRLLEGFLYGVEPTDPLRSLQSVAFWWS